MNSSIKTSAEIQSMKEGGKRLGEILQKLFSHVAIGITPYEIELHAQSLIKKTGGTPSFMTVRNYKWATCICVNDALVHGIPGKIPFKANDVISIDVGLIYNGLHTDTSWSGAISSKGVVSLRIQKFLKAGERALKNAIVQAKNGNRIGNISKIVQETIENTGFAVVPTLTGHGIGKKLHESPQVPGVLLGNIQNTPKLVSGMTIAIEPIYVEGKIDTIKDRDGWTIRTKDGKLGASFEHTVLITDNEPIVLTEWV